MDSAISRVCRVCSLRRRSHTGAPFAPGCPAPREADAYVPEGARRLSASAMTPADRGPPPAPACACRERIVHPTIWRTAATIQMPILASSDAPFLATTPVELSALEDDTTSGSQRCYQHVAAMPTRARGLPKANVRPSSRCLRAQRAGQARQRRGCKPSRRSPAGSRRAAAPSRRALRSDVCSDSSRRAITTSR